MSTSDAFLCLGCMAAVEETPCPYCGYNPDADYDRNYHEPGGILASRYIIGELKHKNGEGATYIGYDQTHSRKVWIREYFPHTIASRDAETGEITPRPGYGAQYKALMSDFMDTCNEVKRLSISDAVIPIENVIPKNNTLYAVYRDLEAITFEEYLSSQGGKLPLEKAVKLFVPLCNTLCNIHNRGTIHRGISPKSVYIDGEENLYLGDFALGATRTGGSELESELFNGYSAPEQYVSNGWQGTWTDVYAVAALFYRTVSGFVPPKSTQISKQRPVAPLIDLVLEIPKSISDTVAKAMEVPAEARIQTIQVFLSRLVSEESDTTAVFDTNRSAQARQPKGSRQDSPSRRKQQKEGGGVSAKSVILALLLTVAVLGGAMWFIMSTYFPDLMGKEPSPSSTSSGTSESSGDPGSGEEDPESSQEPEDNAIPNFVGMNVDEVLANTGYQERYILQTTEDFDETHEEGVIFRQAPEAGIQMPNRGTILLYVSKGTRVISMPDYVGLSYEDMLKAVDELSEEHDRSLGFQVLRRYNASAEPDTVISTSPGPGEDFNPQTDTLYIYVSLAADVSEASVSEAEEASSRASSSSSSTGTAVPRPTRPGQEQPDT